MNDPGQWLWGLLVTFLHWLWSIRWWVAAGIWFTWFQWAIKDTMRSAVQDALNRTVVPLVEDISAKLDEENNDE